MTIGDILEQCDESVDITVMNIDNETVATYDGRNSIPWELDNVPVRTFYVRKTGVTIMTDYVGGAIYE